MASRLFEKVPRYFEKVFVITQLAVWISFVLIIHVNYLIWSFLSNVIFVKTETKCFAVTHNGIMALN